MSKSIEFIGTAASRYEYTINDNQDLDGATTILAVIRMLAANGSWQSIIESESAAGVNQASMGRNATGNGRLYYSDTVSAKEVATIDIVSADSWQIIAITRPAGAAQTIRGHQCILGGATEHDDDSTGNNLGNYDGGMFIVGGDDDPANMRVAAWAIWNTVALTDGDIEDIRDALTTQSILDLNPTACFDSENGLMLTDLTAGGMDGTSGGGTTESVDGPAGWVYLNEAPITGGLASVSFRNYPKPVLRTTR